MISFKNLRIFDIILVKQINECGGELWKFEKK